MELHETRPSRWDLLLGAALAVVAALESWPGGWAQAVLGGATALGLCVRRSHPLASAALVAVGIAATSLLAESPDQVSVLLVVLLSAFTVAGWAATRDALVGLAFLSVSLSMSIAVDPSDSLGNIPPTMLLFIVLPSGLGFAFHRKRDQVSRLEAATFAAVDEERRRIAHELHDVVSHAVTLIAVQSEAGRSVLDQDPPAAGRAFDAIGVASRDALSELQSLLALLRSSPPSATDQRGPDRLPALLDGARASGMQVAFSVSGSRRSASAEVDHCAYRVVQEGLTNALRHTRSPRVEVSVDHGDAVRIRVTSNGVVHQSSYGGTGLGLVQLEERVRGLGGTLRSGPTGHHGFELTASIPQGPA